MKPYYFLTEQKEYWLKILGDKIYYELLDAPDDWLSPDRYGHIEDTEKELTQWLECLKSQIPELHLTFTDAIFGPIFDLIISSFLLWKHPDWDKYALLENPQEVMVSFLYDMIYEIPLRVCIFEMHTLKEKGLFSSLDSTNEYDEYCMLYLKSGNYIYSLCRKYHEMARLLFLRMKYGYENFTEFIERLPVDKTMLEREICNGNQIVHLKSRIMCASDSHKNGKKVLICDLGNGYKVVYKPHGVMKEKLYQNLFHHFNERLGMAAFDYRILDRSAYGWESYLEVSPCLTQKAIMRYFRRMGIHLFLCYLLSGSDAHQENVVAVGEYPVLMDLETIPGIKKGFGNNEADKYIKEFIQRCVLKTGMLPVPVWRIQGKSVFMGALSPREEMSTPFLVPVIVNEKTSDMAIEYKHVRIKMAGSLPIYNGETVDSIGYVEEICKGFSQAYEYWLAEQNAIEKEIQPFWEEETRLLIRHTQQYSMFLNASLSPVYLENTYKRLAMLQVLRKQGMSLDIVRQEISELYQLDIPYFGCRADEVASHLGKSAYQCYEETKQVFCVKDMERQIELIRFSFLSMTQYEERCGKTYENVKRQIKLENNGSETFIEWILNWISLWQEKDENGVGFISTKMDQNGIWGIQSMGPDLYDGMGGLAVFFAILIKRRLLHDTKLFEQILARLFMYTDLGKIRGTGLFSGAGSVAFTYALLYVILQEERFLTYAEKQASLLGAIYIQDKNYDLLSGNAGAIVFLIILYILTKDEKWKSQAIEIGDWLWTKAIKQKQGYGWKLKSCENALGGIAHGNSGFMIAYAALLEHTGNPKYVKIIKELLNYENSLFDDRVGNWRDMRSPEQNIYQNSWCNGASGILLARMKLAELTDFADDEGISKDIATAAKVLFENIDLRGFCLCHGVVGNYFIMRRYRAKYKLNSFQKQQMNNLKMKILRIMSDWSELPFEEKYTMGLMNGIIGIGLGSILLIFAKN